MKILSALKARVISFLLQHAQACIASCGRLCRTPIASLLTIGVIAITLTLATTFFSLLSNLQQVDQSWQSSTSLSIFLYQNTTTEQAQQLMKKLETDYPLTHLTYISPDKGLQLLAKQSGLPTLLTGLSNNPLPGVISADPLKKNLSTQQMQDLVDQIEAMGDVDNVQIDLSWLARLQAILNFAKHLVIALSLLLTAGILLIVANTIRLALAYAQREIEIFQLIGATHAFIRRPFLYIGFWYGLSAGLLAWLMVNSIIFSLQAPAHRISTLYDNHSHLIYLGIVQGAQLCLATIVLALSAAWVMVQYHSRQHNTP